MKRAGDNPLNPFLDVEAMVDNDNEEDDEDEEGNDGGFIDDELTIDATPPRQMDTTPGREGGWQDLVASLEDRYASACEHKTPSPIVELGDKRTTERLLDSEVISSIEHIIAHDYPFWRIRCKPGSAEGLVDFLREMTAARHEMRTAFVYSSTKCWVYLEATMNVHLRHLLKLAPGILRDRSGIISERVDYSDGLRLLKMQTASPVEIGKWVQVRKGIYKGDVGYVTSIEGGRVQLLLIPRLSQPQVPKGNSSHFRCALTLFDCDTVKMFYNAQPVLIEENTYSFRDDRFEYGLVIKSYTSDFISTNISCMSFDALCLFLESCHPKLVESCFLKPKEWHFAEGDEVDIINSDKHGVISVVRSDSVEISTHEGIVCAPWINLRKVIRQGDFVEVTGGTYLGWTGWVGELDEQRGSIGDNIHLRGQIANIIKLEDKDKPLPDRTQIFQVSVNFLKPATIPHVLGTQPQDESPIGRFERAPWINKEIIVVTDGHVFRTLRGIIKDVLCNQPTPSGLRVVVQMHSFMASPSITLDYDGVVEASCGLKLHDYAPPKSDLFIPRNKIPGPIKLSQTLILPPVDSHISNSPGNATPIPEPSPTSSPAWDPSSRTPQPNSDNAELASPIPPHAFDPQRNSENMELAGPSSSLDALDPGPGHPLLDLRLLDARLRVFVTGGKFNKRELTASVRFIEGRLCIQHHFYKAWEALLSEWVTPKHPNPTRDNGLLVVIKGAHCGKYVRRIHHRYEGEEAIVILAVVNRVIGHVDNLSGEQLELDVSHLCVCEESKEDKGLNRSLMNSLREEARKIRAR